MNKKYSWTRFWVSSIGQLNLGDGGYLNNPEGEWGHLYNPDVVPFTAIENRPVLALLGEPGIGKSHVLAEARATAERNGRILFLDLRSIGSENRLIDELFKSKDFRGWANGSYPLTVFLDSLDECLLNINHLAALLVDELRKYPNKEGLYLRIACRTGVWPPSLEAGLNQLWVEAAVGLYELAPLRRKDVIHAVEVEELSVEAFMAEVERHEVVPLAIHPINLRFLINSFRSGGALPPSRTELFRQGCLLLCEEQNQARRDARHMGQYTPGQRMVTAGRIAAVTVLANRDAVWTGSLSAGLSSEGVPLQDLVGGEERGDGLTFQVGEDALRETLSDTGLFSSRGSHRMGFAHRSYAEFLAAWYLTDRSMKAQRILDLLHHPDDPEDKIVPQLQGVAAWLAGMNKPVFNALLKTEPEILLSSDAVTTTVSQRVALVNALLRFCEQGNWVDNDWSLRRQYWKLAHTELTQQLLPYISDQAKRRIVRRVAIDIAEACEVHELQEDLLRIALDQHEDVHIRRQSADAVGGIGGAKTKTGLRPLAFGLAGDDPDDELKGAALCAVWPEHLTAAELFNVDVLNAPKRSNLFGPYQHFLHYELIAGLKPADLPQALKWAAELPSSYELSYYLQKPLKEIMRRAWKFLYEPGVTEAFARAAWTRIKKHEAIFTAEPEDPGNKQEAEDDKRRRVLLAMLPLIENPNDVSWLPQAMVSSRDIPWLVEQLQYEKSKNIQDSLAQVIRDSFDSNDTIQVNLILDACEDQPFLADAFRHLREPILLNSSEAYRQRKRYQDLVRKEKLMEPSPAPRIAEQLTASESGHAEAWIDLCWGVMLTEDSQSADLKETLGWLSADAETQRRIIEAARCYLLYADINTEVLLASTSFRYSDIAGYPALRLLLAEDPEFLERSDTSFWNKWIPLVLEPHFDERTPHSTLLRLAYRKAPQALLYALGCLIDKEIDYSGCVSIVRKLEPIWDDSIAQVALERAKDSTLPLKALENLLSALLEQGNTQARAFAESLIIVPLPIETEARERVLIASEVLFEIASDCGWLVLWPAINADLEFGRELMLRVASSSAGVHQLTESQAVDLFVWLTRQFPPTEDPKYPNGVDVTPRIEVTHFRDRIVQELKERGTHAACHALARIAAEFPDRPGLKWILREAQTITRRNTWMPPAPRDVVALAQDSRLRLVRSGDELLAVIIESLEDLEEKLHGVTPLVRFLWNEKGGTCWPKDENAFSDFVKAHLEANLSPRGTVVDREVEVSRPRGAGVGERTDILVSAFARGEVWNEYKAIHVVIECKCCWNDGLQHAMQTQLRDRYLIDSQHSCGLYLVAWFDSPHWDSKNGRRRKVPKAGLEATWSSLKQQAATLSNEEIRIQALVINAIFG